MSTRDFLFHYRNGNTVFDWTGVMRAAVAVHWIKRKKEFARIFLSLFGNIAAIVSTSYEKAQDFFSDNVTLVANGQNYTLRLEAHKKDILELVSLLHEYVSADVGLEESV
jgi:hypothetical protein